MYRIALALLLMVMLGLLLLMPGATRESIEEIFVENLDADWETIALVELPDILSGRHQSSSFPTKPVVQFSCAGHSNPLEDALEQALMRDNDIERLNALEVLVTRPSPASVPFQWQALQALLQRGEDSDRIADLNRRFEASTILSIIEGPPPNEADNAQRQACLRFHWNVRAAGVLQIKEAIPRLAELGRCGELYSSLAAEASLEDFSGQEADEALVQVYLGYRYNAYIHAAQALLKRNPLLLTEALRTNEAPPDAEYQRALLLARVDSPLAVPLLCKTVPRYQLIDREMFEQVARLATSEQKELVEQLPAIVRDTQQEMAQQCVAAYRQRMSETDNR
jgi:hypothetical protein